MPTRGGQRSAAIADRDNLLPMNSLRVAFTSPVSASRKFLLVLGFCVTAILGYWLAETAAPRPQRMQKPGVQISPKRTAIIDESFPGFRKGQRPPSAYSSDEDAKHAGALPVQRIIVFKDQAAVGNFLKRAGTRIYLMGRLDALNALRIGFFNSADLAALLDGGEESSYIFPVDVPPPGDGAVQEGAVALGAGLLEWLGIQGDHSTWGSGVKIAILDTGVAPHPAFSSAISSQNLVALASDPAVLNGHGTAVASVIIGRDPLTPGVAPGADIVSIRIANDLGQSDSFLLAQGIVAAVDAGADLINISMGSFGDSVLVRNAIEYARAAGTLIIAASGNNGRDRVTYPAANPGVIAVGSVDALGNHLDFSNTGSQLAISAPGLGVNTAWVNNESASVSGTSFSSPIVTGSIAALMSHPGANRLTATQAWALLSKHLNDGGPAGADAAIGAGMPDLGRALRASTPGFHDAALASQRILPPSPGFPNGQLEVLVQNRGTERLINTAVQISSPLGTVTSNITTLEVNAVKALRIPMPQQTASPMRYDSKVILSGGTRDAKPSNDRRVELYAPADAPQ